MNILVRIVVNAIALLVVAWLCAGACTSTRCGTRCSSPHPRDRERDLAAGALLLTLPLQILTLGLFTLVINGFLLWWVAQWHLGLTIDGYCGLLAAILCRSSRSCCRCSSKGRAS